VHGDNLHRVFGFLFQAGEIVNRSRPGEQR
jgi:hypothetical protein